MKIENNFYHMHLSSKLCIFPCDFKTLDESYTYTLSLICIFLKLWDAHKENF